MSTTPPTPATPPTVAAGLFTLGDVMVSFASEVPGPPSRSSRFRLRIAGAEANTAIGVARLGQRATWNGVLSRDDYGDLIGRELRAEGIVVTGRRSTSPTGLLLRTRRTTERSTVHYYRAGSAGTELTPEDVDREALAASAIVHLSGVTPALGTGPAAATRLAADTAHGLGIPVSLALNVRTRLWTISDAVAQLRWLIERSTVVFGTLDEARLVAGSPGADPDQLVAALRAMGPSEVVISDGAGPVTFGGDDQIVISPQAREVVDTVGAGDALCAGYLAARLEGASAPERARMAITVARFAVTTEGDWDGLPTRAEVAQPTGTDIIR